MRGIRNRFKVITQRRVIGEITKDIGIGILVNATYSLSQADFGFNNFLDLYNFINNACNNFHILL